MWVEGAQQAASAAPDACRACGGGTGDRLGDVGGDPPWRLRHRRRADRVRPVIVVADGRLSHADRARRSGPEPAGPDRRGAAAGGGHGRRGDRRDYPRGPTRARGDPGKRPGVAARARCPRQRRTGGPRGHAGDGHLAGADPLPPSTQQARNSIAASAEYWRTVSGQRIFPPGPVHEGVALTASPCQLGSSQMLAQVTARTGWTWAANKHVVVVGARCAGEHRRRGGWLGKPGGLTPVPAATW